MLPQPPAFPGFRGTLIPPLISMFENTHGVLLFENEKFLIKLTKVLANLLMTLPPYEICLITVKSFF